MLSPTNIFAPSIGGPGLTLAVASGEVTIGGALVSIAPTHVQLIANSANFVFFNGTTAVTSNTSGFPTGSYPIAIVTTQTSGVSSIQDVRADILISLG